jgi:hypothetical protein
MSLLPIMRAIMSQTKERYADFVTKHSYTCTVYDSRSALENLLMVLTPDVKGIVLASMDEGRKYGGRRSFYKHINGYLQKLGISDPLPLSPNGVWKNFVRYLNGEKVDGSLVSIGAIEKSTNGFIRSQAGTELFLPLIQRGVDFVYQASLSPLIHRYDSLGRILSTLSSPTEAGRPLMAFDLISFLVNNSGVHSQIEILTALGYTQERMSELLLDFKEAGIIDYETPSKERKGKRGKKWSKYKLSCKNDYPNFETLFQKAKTGKSSFASQANFKAVVEYITDHPDEDYDSATLNEVLNIPSEQASRILRGLSFVGFLESSSKINGKVAHAIASANYLTEMFYDMVCLPAEEVATHLTPLPLASWDKRKLEVFLRNYEAERIHGGEVIDYSAELLEIIRNNGGVIKVSHLEEEYEELVRQNVRQSSLETGIKKLGIIGKVRRVSLGYLQAV